jgi:hypothetical protein
MFIILLTYLKPMTEVENFVVAHRNYLDQGYQQGLLLASGPRVPRTGGVILSATDIQEKLESFFAQDPFYLNDVATYEYIQFTPVKATDLFYQLLNGNVSE